MGYVNDAFGTAHRAHSSMVGEGYEVKVAVALVEKELSAFSKVLDEPARPVLAILGGAKVSDKIQLIKNLTSKVDKMIVGGGMAFTFAKVLHGANIGGSLFDEEGAKIVPEIMEAAKAANVEMIFPMDFTVSSKFGEDGEIKEGVTLEEGVPDGFMGLDCGPLSNEKNKAAIMESKTHLERPNGCLRDGQVCCRNQVYDGRCCCGHPGWNHHRDWRRRHGYCVQEVRHGGQGHALLDRGWCFPGASRGQGPARNLGPLPQVSALLKALPLAELGSSRAHSLALR